MSKRKPPEVRRLEMLLEEWLIPWVRGEAPLVLLRPEPYSTAPAPIRDYPTEPLPEPKVTSAYPQRNNWNERHLNSTAVLIVGCVTDGEADYRVHTPPGAPPHEWVVTVTQGSFFIVPPNTPFSDGGKVAWERPHPERAFARGLLIHLRRDGASCHTYTCQDGKLWLHPYIFVFDFEAVGLGQKLEAEIARPQGLHSPMTRLYMELLLRHLVRSIEEEECTTLHAPHMLYQNPREEQHPPRTISPDRVVPYATEFIRLSLSDRTLDCAAVAEKTGFSQRHLNRIFQKETGMSVPAMIRHLRSEKACDLLAHGSLSVHLVALYCGFGRTAAFSTWFFRMHGCTPTDYRRQHQKY